MIDTCLMLLKQPPQHRSDLEYKCTNKSKSTVEA